jgi:hypothetical protein
MNNIPSVLAIVLCDWIIIEQDTGKKTLVGLFDNLNSSAFPFLRPMGFYARLLTWKVITSSMSESSAWKGREKS